MSGEDVQARFCRVMDGFWDARFYAHFNVMPCDASARLLDPDAIVTQRPSDGVTAGSDCGP